MLPFFWQSNPFHDFGSGFIDLLFFNAMQLIALVALEKMEY